MKDTEDTIIFCYACQTVRFCTGKERVSLPGLEHKVYDVCRVLAGLDKIPCFMYVCNQIATLPPLALKETTLRR